MSERLDDLVGRLAASPTDRSLDGFDAEVSRGVAQWSARARTTAALKPIRFATIVAALVIGVVGGGVTAAGAIAAPDAPNVFSLAAHLAPSTLLDGGR
jgi:hypothetical protein